MCDKATLKNSGTLKSVPDCYKNQQMCNKAVDNYLHSLKFVPECYKTQKWCIFLQANLFLNAIRLKK